MRFWRIVLAASALEAAALSAVLGLLQLASGFNGWFDALTNFAPLTGLVGVLGAVLAIASLPRGRQRHIVLAVAGIGLLSTAVRMGPEVFRPLPHARTASIHPLHMLTFNVWNENFDIPGTVKAIKDADVDVVDLQEASEFMKQAKDSLLQRYPYLVQCKPYWICQDVILSKRPVLASGAILPSLPPKDGELNLIWMKTTGPDQRPFTIVTTHLAWPIPPGPQREERRKLIAAMQPLIGPDTILAGDFNLTPWSGALRELDRGLTPMVRRTHGLFSWPANIPRIRKPSPLPVLPIDQIFAGPAWVDSTVKRLPRAGSDHYGVLATLTR